MKFKKIFVVIVCSICIFQTTLVNAEKKFKHDDTLWFSLGVGVRSSFISTENKVNDKWQNRLAIDNFRLYFNAQLHKYLKFEINSECADCTESGDFIVLDAIAKIDISDYFNLWVGRLLVPSDRAELNGPFYHSTYQFNKTPFYPSDYGSWDAGKFGRDYGFNVWGVLTPDKKLTYAFGVFRGRHNASNKEDNLLYAGRISYNFLNVEDNPGYYTSSTYYGKTGDIFTLAVASQYQSDAAGSVANPADFWGISVDLLSETVLPNGNGVATIEIEYKHFNLNRLVTSDSNNFGLFEGNAYTGTALYLFQKTIGYGKFQPYVRYTYNDPDHSSSRDEVEVGLNYIIDGHNARVSMAYQYGDIATKGRNYSPSIAGEEISTFMVGLQLQY